jgi:hypothetical protein
MRFIKEEPSGVDSEIDCPLFKLNYREVEILWAVLGKADTYIPDFLMPDKSRIKQMQKTLSKYMRQKEIDARRMKIEVEGLNKPLVLTAHAIQRMQERDIPLEYIKKALIKARPVVDQISTKVYEHETVRFIVDEREEDIVLITLYRNEEIVDV